MSVRLPHLKKFNRFIQQRGLEPREMDHRPINRFLKELETEGFAPGSVQNHYRTIRLFFHGYLSGWVEVIEKSPTRKLSESDYGGSKKDKNRHRKYVHRSEKDQLREHVNSPATRNEAIIETIWQTGLRAGEVANIRLEDIEWDKCQVNNLGHGVS